MIFGGLTCYTSDMPPPADGFAARLVLGPALRAQPDRRLVALVREGYETAFEEIVRRYGRPLTRYAGAIVGSRAEDVTQDAFSKALLAMRRDGAEIELRPWLFRIVRNAALNELRDSPPSAEALAGEIAGGGSPAEVLERREELAGLIRRLRSLPEPQRAAIVMRELEGLSHEEIAAALGLSGGGARQAIYRARQALREGLGLLLPLPLLRALIAQGGDAAVGAAAGGAGGAAAASGALGGAGAGVALKAGVVGALLAGSVGAGVALHDHGHQQADAATAAASSTVRRATAPNPAAPAPTVPAALEAGLSAAAGAGGRHGQDSPGSAGPGRDLGGSSHAGLRRHAHHPRHGLGPEGGWQGPHGPRHHGSRRHEHPAKDGPRGTRGGGGGGAGSHSGPRPGGRPPRGGRGDGGGQGGPRPSNGEVGAPRGGKGNGDGPGGTLPPPPPPPPKEETREGDEGSGSEGAEPGSASGASPGAGEGGEELP